MKSYPFHVQVTALITIDYTKMSLVLSISPKCLKVLTFSTMIEKYFLFSRSYCLSTDTNH